MSDNTEQTIRQLGENAAAAAKEYGADKAKLQARIAQLEAEVARLREVVASAYREGFFDGGDMETTEQLFDDWQKCWPISTAFKALQETADGTA